MKHHKFIFIGGLHRSGTSVFHRCLREHPLISGFNNTGVYEDEGQHLQTVYPPAKVHGGAGRFGFDPKAHLTETSNLISDKQRTELYSQWARFWNLEKPFLLEKSPPNLVRMRFLQALFPDSYFIVMTRHPIAVAFATQKWSKTSIASLIEHWLVCQEIFEEDKPHIKRLLTLKYEDFVNNPQMTLEKTYAFLGLNNHKNSIEIRQNINQKYFDLWRNYQQNFLRRSKNFIRRDFFDAWLIKLKYEKRVKKFGYSLREQETQTYEYDQTQHSVING